MAQGTCCMMKERIKYSTKQAQQGIHGMNHTTSSPHITVWKRNLSLTWEVQHKHECTTSQVREYFKCLLKGRNIGIQGQVILELCRQLYYKTKFFKKKHSLTAEMDLDSSQLLHITQRNYLKQLPNTNCTSLVGTTFKTGRSKTNKRT